MTTTEKPHGQPTLGIYRTSRGRRVLNAVVFDWGSLIVLGLVWELLGWTLQLRWLPPLSVVIRELVTLFLGKDFVPYLLSSLGVYAIGLSIAIIVGLCIGILMGLSSRLFAALDIYVNALMVTPSLIFAPILFAIFGLSDITRISVVVLYGVFVVIINTSAGIRSVDQPLLDMAASCGASRITTVRRIVLPSAFPMTIAGLRLAVGRCLKGMVNGEMFIALVGIGGVVSAASRQHNYSAVWAISLLLMTIAIILNQFVSRAEKRFTSWVG